MCGIAGCVALDGLQENRYTEEACEMMRHRGPDATGFFDTLQASLGMCRLAVIGIHDGNQPIYDTEGSVVCVVNGEIYNHHELRRELEASGIAVQGTSDVSVIPGLYRKYGDRFVERLQGMFAIALWDAAKEKLLLITDRAGKKPIVYAETGEGRIVFASELHAVLRHPAVGREINTDAIDEYLSYRVVPGPATIYKQVRKLEPATILCLDRTGNTSYRYWDFPFTAEFKHESDEDLAHAIGILLENAVDSRMESDVPLGAMLSGGLDSSLVVALASSKLATPLHTFSVGFDHPAFDESEYATMVSQFCGTVHHKYQLTPDDAARSIDEILFHVGEPFAFPSAIASNAMYRLARNTVEVVLTGDGSDEIFGGYNRYKRLLSGPLSDVASEYEGILIDGVDNDLKKRLYTKRFRDSLPDFPKNYLRARFSETDQAAPPLDRAMHVDARFWLPDAQLVKIDRMAMAHSVEPRSPFLDQHLVEYVARIPASRKIQHGNEKALLKKAARQHLPAAVIDRPKQELAVPLEKWLTSSLRSTIQATLTSEDSLGRGYFDPDALRSLVEEFHPRHSYALWTLFMLERWHQLELGSPEPINIYERSQS